MYRKFQPFFIIAESPIHAGSGTELGLVDLPIQRERYTKFPKIEGSGIKGSIREVFEHSQSNNKMSINHVFGPEDGDAHAGSIAFTDAKILLFPVRSLKGVFAWITCPMVLYRFYEDMKFSGKEDKLKDLDLTDIEKTVPSHSDLLISDTKVILEEFTFEVKKDDKTAKIAEKLSEIIFPNHLAYEYWRNKLKKDLVILLNDDFANFVTTSTEVITRTKISNETGTVEPGALWTEEYLPQDTILYSIALTTVVKVANDEDKGPFKGSTSDEEAQKVMEFFKQGLPEVIHIGGNQTIGKGIVRIKIWED
ncbi:type III-B CRISPR module RAMP protein Cmr4 [Bacteroidetes/Chlorobi group bacterium Naka2016]|jgi:CRISPR-associated protein Cmr4|nr:MAG: type III-B CRISPR module RAMP protein Cmr4 [Bacteroidetes/Chlorobi group bacterium Naka2016]